MDRRLGPSEFSVISLVSAVEECPRGSTVAVIEAIHYSVIIKPCKLKCFTACIFIVASFI